LTKFFMGHVSMTVIVGEGHLFRVIGGLVAILTGLAGCTAISGHNVETVSTVGSQGAAAEPARPATADSRAMGRLDAPVAIVEYSDYQCPYCQRFHAEVLPQLKRRYIDTGKVRYFFRDLPLSIHRESMSAAVAARCAADQGKFWEMNEALFANQLNLGADLYDRLAPRLALDQDRFRSCMHNPAMRQAVQRDAQDAGRYALQSTPSFILGRVDGGRVEIHRVARGFADVDTFAREIDAVLAATPVVSDGSATGKQ
jgi:protein-disulfide isomerase